VKACRRQIQFGEIVRDGFIPVGGLIIIIISFLPVIVGFVERRRFLFSFDRPLVF
jgi:hypothetical protein